jgi:hypothetical protein
MLDVLREKGFEIQFVSHAGAILERDFPAALEELEAALSSFEIPITEIIGSGGGETNGTQRMRHALSDLGWKKVHFEIKKTINPFYDRDLENFKRLHAEGAISIGSWRPISSYSDVLRLECTA